MTQPVKETFQSFINGAIVEKVSSKKGSHNRIFYLPAGWCPLEVLRIENAIKGISNAQ